MSDSYVLKPYIYALMICSKIERDTVTGGWQLSPLNHLAVRMLPTSLNVSLFVGVMGPPGTYQLRFRLFHTEDSVAIPLFQPVNLPVQANKNVEYIGQASITLKNVGLYLVEAALNDYYLAYSPLRLSTVAATEEASAQTHA